MAGVIIAAMTTRAQIRAITSFGDDPEKVEIVLPPGDVKAMLSQVATKPQFQLYGMGARYSYPDNVLATLPTWPANITVEVALPYCFNLLNGILLSVKGAEFGDASLVLNKIWTEFAAGSSMADFYAADRLTYHAPTSLQTPNFPERPELGPVPRCTGTNIERDRDTSGSYRYTRAEMFFNTAYPATIISNHEEYKKAETEVIEAALQVANRLIDVYRLVTKVLTFSDYLQSTWWISSSGTSTWECMAARLATVSELPS